MNCRSSHRRCSVRKGFLRNIAKFTSLQLFKKETLAIVNFAKFLRTPFLPNTSRRLLLELWNMKYVILYAKYEGNMNYKIFKPFKIILCRFRSKTCEMSYYEIKGRYARIFNRLRHFLISFWKQAQVTICLVWSFISSKVYALWLIRKSSKWYKRKH